MNSLRGWAERNCTPNILKHFSWCHHHHFHRNFSCSSNIFKHQKPLWTTFSKKIKFHKFIFFMETWAAVGGAMDTHEMKIVYTEGWFNTLWRLRTGNLWNFTTDMIRKSCFEALTAILRATFSTLTERMKLKNDISPILEKCSVALMKTGRNIMHDIHKEILREVHPCMKIIWFLWDALAFKMTLEFPPTSRTNNLMLLSDNYAIHLSSE